MRSKKRRLLCCPVLITGNTAGGDRPDSLKIHWSYWWRNMERRSLIQGEGAVFRQWPNPASILLIPVRTASVMPLIAYVKFLRQQLQYSQYYSNL
ncbi:hypothetical protein E2C01_059721 [Portunus trituberculatus]|uniref:Uncharacterized protein n=1 Tax=Portunus trituberculatus TaxID=210409 RepID=A0A5B7H649_PORTR|nr:hypothetical protein [Portunus trituberculatus]